MIDQHADAPEEALPEGPPPDDAPPQQEEMPPIIIEGARSSRSKCKGCRKKIDKGVLRIGIPVNGPYGPGHMWHHLKCAARRHLEILEEAYAEKAWERAKEKVDEAKLPALDDLRKEKAAAEKKKADRKQIPYAEFAPSNRSKCKGCGEAIEKGAVRIVLGREIVFGSQIRTAPANVHPKCVMDELDHPESNTEAENLEEQIRQNTKDGVDEAALSAALAQIEG